MSVVQNDVHSTQNYVKILMVSGACPLIIHDSFVHTNKFDTRKTSTKMWSMMAGSILTSYEAKVKIKLPESDGTAHILHHFM